MNYECHITLDLKDAVVGQILADELKWKTSEIARDPILGQRTYFYLTKHSTDYSILWRHMVQMSESIKKSGALVVREKIEQILWDTKLLQAQQLKEGRAN